MSAFVAAGYIEINKFGMPDPNPAFVALPGFGILCRATSCIPAVVANGIAIAWEGRRGLARIWYSEHNLYGRRVNINLAPIDTMFRASGRCQNKAQRAGKGCSLVKGCNAVLAPA